MSSEMTKTILNNLTHIYIPNTNLDLLRKHFHREISPRKLAYIQHVADLVVILQKQLKLTENEISRIVNFIENTNEKEFFKDYCRKLISIGQANKQNILNCYGMWP